MRVTKYVEVDHIEINEYIHFYIFIGFPKCVKIRTNIYLDFKTPLIHPCMLEKQDTDLADTTLFVIQSINRTLIHSKKQLSAADADIVATIFKKCVKDLVSYAEKNELLEVQYYAKTNNIKFNN